MKGEIAILILIGSLFVIITAILFLILCTKAIISFVKKKPFPKKLLIATISGVLLISSIYIYKVYLFSFDVIDREFTQQGIGPLLSADGKYTANAYYEPYGGAASGVNVWVEVTNHHEHDKKEIIYYSKANQVVLIDWVDNNRLFITNAGPRNNSAKLEVEKDIYHDKGWACQSWLMKNEYENCYRE